MQGLDVRAKLIAFFVDREGQEIESNLDTIDLVDEGILDSLDFLTLAAYIETEFGFKLNLTDETTFISMRRLSTLQELIESKVG